MKNSDNNYLAFFAILAKKISVNPIIGISITFFIIISVNKLIIIINYFSFLNIIRINIINNAIFYYNKTKNTINNREL